MKRGRPSAGDLTGGSRDVNPQWFNISLTQTSADLNTTLSVPLPVQRLAQRSGKSLVMEILRIYWDIPSYVPPSSQGMSMIAWLTTKDPAMAVIAGITLAQFLQYRRDGTTIDYINRFLQSGGSNGGVVEDLDPQVHDLTDGAGHGILVASDNVFLNFASVIGSSTATGNANNILCKILYRWKEVSLEEYIGIVQSQQ